MIPKTVLVLSGKGGTGKSVVSLNIANTLKAMGKKVCLVDCDLDNAHIPSLLAIEGQLPIVGKIGSRRFLPLEHDGMQILSMSFISGDMSVSMSGSSYERIIRDVFLGTDWNGEYLVCDLPAGSGSVFREVAKTVAENLLGSIVVMQPAHSDDAARVIELHEKEGLPILGLVENMAYFQCGHDEKYYLFGPCQGEEVAKTYGVKFLGEIPIESTLAGRISEGKPFLLEESLGAIKNAAETIIASRPIEKSIVERIRQGVKDIGRESILDLLAFGLRTVNEVAPIGQLASEHGFTGGRLVQLNITNKDLDHVKISNCFILSQGFLKLVPKPDPTKIDLSIYIWDQAFIWASLGYMVQNGQKMEYSWKQAYLMNKVEVYGASFQDALELIDGLWKEIPPRLQQSKLYEVFERFA